MRAFEVLAGVLAHYVRLPPSLMSRSRLDAADVFAGVGAGREGANWVTKISPTPQGPSRGRSRTGWAQGRDGTARAPRGLPKCQSSRQHRPVSNGHRPRT